MPRHYQSSPASKAAESNHEASKQRVVSEVAVEAIKKRATEAGEWIYKTSVVLSTNDGVKTCFGEAFAIVERLAFEGDTEPGEQFDFADIVVRRHIQFDLDTAAFVYKLRLDIAPHAKAARANSVKVGVEAEADHGILHGKVVTEVRREAQLDLGMGHGAQK